MANTYPTGSNVRFSVEFKDPVTGAYVDPTTVTFKIITPETGQLAATYTLPPGPEVVKDAVGQYHCDYTIDYPGEWPYRWEGSGAYIGANEYYVCARETAFPV